MKNRHLTLPAVFLSAAAILAAVVLWRPGQVHAPADPGPAGEQPESLPGGEGHEHDEGVVHLSEEQLKRFSVETAAAGPGHIRIELTFPGEVALNADRVAHMVPRVSGVVREVRKNLGDRIRRGEIAAVLESRELADGTAALLAARERLTMARSNYAREEQLFQKKISPEQDYIQARNALAETNIELRAAEQKLRAVGFSDDYIAQLAARQGQESILYEMIAPFDATVIEKHISLGEVLKDDSAAFVIADLSSVWVNLDVHQRDLPFVRVGQIAAIGVGNAITDVQARISFMEPLARETNRTVHARVVLANADGRWRPGLFVTGRITVDDVEAPVAVPSQALVMVGGRMCVFVREGEEFRLQPVTPGRTDGSRTEITSGLDAGQVYVLQGAFTLKSELEKPEAEHKH